VRLPFTWCDRFTQYTQLLRRIVADGTASFKVFLGLQGRVGNRRTMSFRTLTGPRLLGSSSPALARTRIVAQLQAHLWPRRKRAGVARAFATARVEARESTISLPSRGR